MNERRKKGEREGGVGHGDGRRRTEGGREMEEEMELRGNGKTISIK